jgi:hypothetical protein
VSSYLRLNLASIKPSARYYGINFIDTTIAAQTIQDSAVTWTSAGMTSGSATSTPWTAPHRESPNCFVKIVAIDGNGIKYPGISPRFSLTLGTAPIIPPPDNNYALRGTATAGSAVRLAWSLVSAVDTSVDSIGIRYSVAHYPSSMTDSLSTLIRVYSLSETCDTIEPLPPNQPYYFSLFVANGAHVWSAATQNSRLLIRASQPAGTVVALGLDTQHVFNDSLRLWTKPGLLNTYTDTLDVWSGLQTRPGFIATSQAYAFRQGNTPANTTVGIPLAYRPVPSPFTANDQQVYQYNIFTGKWRLVTSRIRLDTAQRMIHAVCEDARMLFVLMIDTAAPQLSKISTSKDYYTVTEMIQDTCIMTDNIENLPFRFLIGAGNRELAENNMQVTQLENPAHWLVQILPSTADQCSGLQAYLIVNDGRTSRRINLSEKILRDGVNPTSTRL